MLMLEAKNLYSANVLILGVDYVKIPVVVYKKDNRYYDMKLVFTKEDLTMLNHAYYTEYPEFNQNDRIIESIDKSSLNNYYNDDRELFDVDELHYDMKQKAKTKRIVI